MADRLQSRLRRPAWWGGLLALAAGTGAFTLSCSLMATPGLPPTTAAPDSMLAALLGASRLAMSGRLFTQADITFHRGVGPTEKLAFSNHVFQRLHREISPQACVHLSGQSVKEMVPWLWMAVEADPHNVDAYLVAAFWIANDGGRPDLALRILEEGRWNNPYSYEMALEIARLDLRMGKLDQARQALDAGLRFWNKTADPKSEGSRSDLASLLLYRSILHEIDGEGAEAVVNLESIIALFPDRAHLRAQIAAIKRGENMPQEAAKRLMDTLRAEARQRSACRHEAAEADESHQHVDTH